eukprot:scaffold107566_cov69-Phaeocystis_antarctica.AAC.3
MIILPIGEAYLPTRAACAACTLSRFCAAWLGLGLGLGLGRVGADRGRCGLVTGGCCCNSAVSAVSTVAVSNSNRGLTCGSWVRVRVRVGVR